MTPLNDLVIAAAANTGTVTSAPIPAKFLLAATAQAVFTDGAAAGTLKLEASNDDKNPTHWNDIPDASESVSAGATTMTPILATYLCYQWIRVNFESSGGSGTLSVRLHGWGA
jgi:hypothetical protein